MNNDLQKLTEKTASEIKPRLIVSRRSEYTEFDELKQDKLEFSLDGAEKRKRSSNFHFQEIEDLMTLIDVEKSIIECKRTDQLTNSYKEKTWKKISHIFNRKNVTKRSDKQLRSKWETLKKIARKEYSSGNLSPLSSDVVKIMLSCNGMDVTFNSDFAFKMKEEPYFCCDTVKNIKNDSSTGVIGNQEENNEIRTKDLLQINLTDQSSKSQTIDEFLDVQQSQVRLITRATQYDLHDLNKVRDNRRFRWYTNANKINVRNFEKIFYSAENKRKREKHLLEMKVLRVELSIKKRQLENLRG